MERIVPAIDRVSSGLARFDALADGGLPRSSVTVVRGGAGSGKTIFGMRFLASGVRDHDAPAIVVAFEESAARIRANTAGFVCGAADRGPTS